MFKLIASILLALAACSAAAQDFNGNGLRVQRQATTSDGWMGGVWVTRDTYGLSGGTPGWVNSGLTAYSKTGPGVHGFEWNLLAVHDNYATSGENVGAYFQGNKYSTGATWGSVSECADTTGLAGACFGTEIDAWVSGPDNGNRFGALIVTGDAKAIRGIPGGGVAKASTGILIGATGATPWARWSNGIVLRDYESAGMVLQGDATRGIWMHGSHIVALDLSDTTGQTAIRLKAGQRVTFDQYDQFGARQDAATQELVFDYAGVPIMRLSPGGHLYVKGQVWQNQ